MTRTPTAAMLEAIVCWGQAKSAGPQRLPGAKDWRVDQD